MIIRILIALLLTAFGAAPALACDCVRLVAGGPHFDRDMDAIVASADAIVEGVVVQPMGPMLEPATFRPTRILKGPRQETYRIGIVSDCGLLLRAPEVPTGVPIRLILYGGPDLYEASRCASLQGADVDAAVDRRLRPACGRR